MNTQKCIVALDAMGGDYAPENTVLGAVDALKESSNLEVLLLGKRELIREILNKHNLEFPESNIIHTTEVIGMSESPTSSLRNKRDSSIVVGANLVKEKKVQAFVSAGNTGAVMAASTLLIGRIKGVGRPTIGASFPTSSGKFCTVYDVGASVDCKPNHLFEYALLGDIFIREINGNKNPTIGLLSVGEENSKGNSVTLAANKLLSESNLNYVGNVEGRDILNGSVDIVICDGFVGNIILKFGESVMGFLKSKLKEYAGKSFINKLKVLSMRGTLRASLKDLDYQTHGGAPLIGINGISIIGHGSSSALAIKYMILKAKEMHDKNIIKKFEDSIKNYALKSK